MSFRRLWHCAKNLTSAKAPQHRRALLRTSFRSPYSQGAALPVARILATSRESLLGREVPALPLCGSPLRMGNDGIACLSRVSSGWLVNALISASGYRSRICLMTDAMMASSPRFLLPT